MKSVFYLLVLFLLSLLSCDKLVKSKHEIDNNNFNNKLNWVDIKNSFPNKNIFKYDFDELGTLINKFYESYEVDSLMLKKLMSSSNKYSNKSIFTNTFYYSANKFKGKNYGIFIIKTHIDDVNYLFDMVEFDDNGEILRNLTISKSSNGAECRGYIRANIDTNNNQIYQESIEKCYDEHAENNELVDSVVSIIKINNDDFTYIRSDTIKNELGFDLE